MADAAFFDDQQRGRSNLHPLPVAPPVPVELPPTRRRPSGDGLEGPLGDEIQWLGRWGPPGHQVVGVDDLRAGCGSQMPGGEALPAPE